MPALTCTGGGTVTAAGLPIVSVDTKKKELIGNFRNGGRSWCRSAPEVDEHDFPSKAVCQAVPFGVYDVTKNAGFVVVGTSYNTPQFAVSAIARWWQAEGRDAYPGADRLLILADGGGGNGSRAGAWKVNLQERLCNRHRLTVTVCHYPPGCSKWNPVEHRLFSQISKNWEGQPLRSLDLMLGYIRGTTTRTGLRVSAELDDATYPKGQKVTRDDLGKVSFKPHADCPIRNYTISPQIADQQA
ncbi:ISAzo13 family transposase [Frigoriglobus tundricola]|uniref:ISAzo13 family transposase n=1 Tax=Frigoriglobus tundricola TaxID=2774151 RepID=UPI00148E9CF5|nr:ISAzo13 family transposase [Frigoriglobus tundricola]